MFTLKNPSSQSNLKNLIIIKGGKLDNQTISVDPNPDKSRMDDYFYDLTIEDGGTLQLCPPDKGRICAFISGKSNSGKSYWCSKFLTQYKEKFPNNEIVLISPITDDTTLNKHNPHRISINDENFIEDKVTLEELKDSLVIFDDVCAVTDKLLREEVQNLANKILLTGRHYNISTLITEHNPQITNSYVKNCLNESHVIVVFPHGGSTANYLNRLLKTHIGLSTKQINEFYKIPSRYVQIWNNYPSFIMGSDQLYMLHKLK